MIMTPALGFFYGGLVRRKNLVSTIIQTLTIFSVVSLIWAFWAYSLSFSPSVDGLIGNLSNAFMMGVGAQPNPAYSGVIPALLFFAFQLKFAGITPALMIGAFAERISFKALLIFIVLWTTLIYSPVANWVWGQTGWLHSLGVIDFAGGLVVHLTAGVSAVAAAIVLGRRSGIDKKREIRPNNIPFVILGAAILWFGWFGFNGGSALAADDIAVQAIVNTNMAAAAAAVSWMLMDWWRRGKPSAVGIAVGAVAGLVAITPAAGYVTTMAAIVIGLVGGTISNTVANWYALRAKLDDSLDVFAAHGAGSIWGVLATGIFATTMVNPNGPNGLLYGNPHQFLLQAFGLLVVGTFSFVGAYALLRLTNLITPLRVSPEEEEEGLDITQHGEESYE
ncbi:MAG: ammonium transporter [Nitrososphaerota archaeon]|nr:ammonium transporter [Nitrososphaerota archaeon]MDG7038952.1 ammonium transporter [Nitrososphaerota archaeon]MDG7043603.1 ammonium transporter [Nitrososphaerota archaeon]MDG7045948.1 ammonium transporter [Nitrososphaerota archaeon]